MGRRRGVLRQSHATNHWCHRHRQRHHHCWSWQPPYRPRQLLEELLEVVVDLAFGEHFLRGKNSCFGKKATPQHPTGLSPPSPHLAASPGSCHPFPCGDNKGEFGLKSRRGSLALTRHLLLGAGFLLGEDAENEISFLVGFKGGGHHDVLSRRQPEPGAHLPQVDELLRAGTRGVGQEEIPLQVDARFPHVLPEQVKKPPTITPKTPAVFPGSPLWHGNGDIIAAGELYPPREEPVRRGEER